MASTSHSHREPETEAGKKTPVLPVALVNMSENPLENKCCLYKWKPLRWTLSYDCQAVHLTMKNSAQ